jgi:hypothetical protein
MSRVRWLSAEWPVSMRVLGSRMKAQTFTPESFDGFVIERIRENFIDAHYIEKFTYEEKTIDPFGNEETLNRISYKNVGFTLFSDFPNIELRNPQRSIKEFISKLLELCDFSLSITPVTVNLVDWIQAIQKQTNQNVLVDSLQIAGLELEEGVSAKILLRGSKDVREAMRHLSGNRKFDFEKAQVKMTIESRIAPVHLSNTGSARIPPDYFDDLAPILRTTLPRPIAKNKLN